MNADRPDPRANGTRPVRSDGPPTTAPAETVGAAPEPSSGMLVFSQSAATRFDSSAPALSSHTVTDTVAPSASTR